MAKTIFYKVASYMPITRCPCRQGTIDGHPWYVGSIQCVSVCGHCVHHDPKAQIVECNYDE